MRTFFAALATVALVASNVVADGHILYSEGFDSDAADVKINRSDDSTVDFIDYSNFMVGAESFSIAEAPRMVAGSAATSGLLLTVNQNDDVGAAAAVNVLAGADPITFSGNYIMTYDVYMSTHSGLVPRSKPFSASAPTTTTASKLHSIVSMMAVDRPLVPGLAHRREWCRYGRRSHQRE